MDGEGRPAWRDVGAVLVCLAVFAGAVGAYRSFPGGEYDAWFGSEAPEEGGFFWAMANAQGCGWASLALGAIGLGVALRWFPHQVGRGSLALLLPPSVVLLATLPTVVMTFVELGAAEIGQACIMLFLEYSLLSCALQSIGLALLVGGLYRRETPAGPRPLLLATGVAVVPALIPAPFFSAAIVSEGFFHLSVVMLLGGWALVATGAALMLVARGRDAAARIPPFLCLCGALLAGPGTIIVLANTQGLGWSETIRFLALLGPTTVVALPAALTWWRSLPAAAERVSTP